MQYSYPNIAQQMLTYSKKYSSIDLSGKTLQGEALRLVLKDLMDYDLLCFANSISIYDKENLFDMAGRMVRGVEEFINLMTEIDPNDYWTVMNFQLGNYDAIPELDSIIYRNFQDRKVVGRLINIYIQLSVFSETTQRLGIDLEIRTIGDGIGYLQSRRIYLQTLQSLIALYCNGTQKIDSREMMIVLFPPIEFYLMRIGYLSDYIPPSYCLEDYTVKITGTFPGYSFESNYDYRTLENFFLVPLRFPAMEMLEYLEFDKTKAKPPNKAKNKIFSFEEFEVMPENWKVLFSEYGLDKCTLFGKYADLFKDLRPNVLHDYFIAINKTALLDKIKTFFGEKETNAIYDSLLVPENDFIGMVNSRNPFVIYNGVLYSNVNLLSKFLIFLTEDYLNTIKKYQIDAGFAFEKVISTLLQKHKYDIREIKRIKNTGGTYSEFDVIALKDGEGYNFQCKNNIIDISNIKTDLHKFKQRNDYLLAAYEKAYNKELNREKHLLDKLSVKVVHHVVVTRFPVITRSPHIITYQRFEDWIRENRC